MDLINPKPSLNDNAVSGILGLKVSMPTTRSVDEAYDNELC